MIIKKGDYGMSTYVRMFNKLISLMGMENYNADYQYRNHPEKQRQAKIQLDGQRSHGAAEFKRKKKRLHMAKESRRRNRLTA